MRVARARVAERKKVWVSILAGVIGFTVPVCFASGGAKLSTNTDSWRAIPDDELLVLKLATGKSVIIRLATNYAPQHVSNVKALARTRWWDATHIYRVKDNWVTQWGDATRQKQLPSSVEPRPAPEFDFTKQAFAYRLKRSDAYSTESGFTSDAWPLASNGAVSWIPHCYGTVGVAHGAHPDTGSGSELFVAIGGSARRLDRNFTVIGRVIFGMEALSSLQRSATTMGFYADAREFTTVVSARLLSDSEPDDRAVRYEYRSVESDEFRAAVTDREHPAPPMIALGGVDVCDVPLEVRARPKK